MEVWNAVLYVFEVKAPNAVIDETPGEAAKAKAGKAARVMRIPRMRFAASGQYDCLTTLYETLKSDESQFNEQEGEKRLYRITEIICCQEDRVLTGVVEKGSYGEKKDIVSHRSRDVTYKMTKEEAPLARFPFLVYMPAPSTQGILIARIRGTDGVYTELEASIQRAVNAACGGAPKFDRYCPPGQLEKIIQRQTKIQAISFTRRKPSRDTVGSLETFGIAEELGSLEYVIKPKQKGNFRGFGDKLLEMLPAIAKAKPPERIHMFQGMVPEGLDPTSMRVTVNIGGKIRTLSISDFNLGHHTFEIELDDAESDEMVGQFSREMESIAVATHDSIIGINDGGQ